MVTAQEFGRSLRGTAALVNRRSDALRAFDISADGFARSFSAVALTLPAYVVSLGLERRRLGLDVGGSALFDQAGPAILVGVAHLASFLALPIAMVFVTRHANLGGRYVSFVVVSNWLWAFASLGLAIPGALYLCGLETQALAALFTLGFAAVALHAQVFAARVTLGVSASMAVTVAALGLLLDLAVDLGLRATLG